MIPIKTKINTQIFNISILKKKNYIYIYLYKNYFFCILKIKKPSLILKNSTIQFNNTDIQELKLNLFLRQFYLCSFSKIKFSGKGYKIKKNSKQSLILLFNKSHTTIVWWKNIFIKKLKKYKIYLKYNYKNVNIIKTILNIRPINIFTKKGLRNSQQIIKKKKGKK